MRDAAGIMDFFQSSAVAALAICCVSVLIYNDFTTIRFFAAPSPSRVWRVRVLRTFSFLALLGLYASGMIFVTTVGFWCLKNAGIAGPKNLPSRPVITGLVLGGFFGTAFLRRSLTTIARYFAGRGQSGGTNSQSPATSIRNAGATLPWFAAMSYYALMLNRTYKVFLADTMLCGAVVNGLVASPPTGSPEFEDQSYWTDTVTATLYEKLDVTSETFKRLGWNNFQIPWPDINRVDYDPRPKWGMGNVSHSGKIYLRLRSGRSRELILLGKQDGEGLKRTMQKFVAGPSPT
jgi:hypothetical protein